MAVTAKVRCASRITGGNGYDVVRFTADYADGANAEWAHFTPVINVSMNVKPEVEFDVGAAYTLIFEPASS